PQPRVGLVGRGDQRYHAQGRGGEVLVVPGHRVGDDAVDGAVGRPVLQGAQLPRLLGVGPGAGLAVGVVAGQPELACRAEPYPVVQLPDQFASALPGDEIDAPGCNGADPTGAPHVDAPRCRGHCRPEAEPAVDAGL